MNDRSTPDRPRDRDTGQTNRMTVRCKVCGFRVDPGKETRCPCGNLDLDQ